jgi:hypothetical protein
LNRLFPKVNPTVLFLVGIAWWILNERVTARKARGEYGSWWDLATGAPAAGNWSTEAKVPKVS